MHLNSANLLVQHEICKIIPNFCTIKLFFQHEVHICFLKNVYIYLFFLLQFNLLHNFSRELFFHFVAKCNTALSRVWQQLSCFLLCLDSVTTFFMEIWTRILQELQKSLSFLTAHAPLYRNYVVLFKIIDIFGCFKD